MFGNNSDEMRFEYQQAHQTLGTVCNARREKGGENDQRGKTGDLSVSSKIIDRNVPSPISLLTCTTRLFSGILSPSRWVPRPPSSRRAILYCTELYRAGRALLYGPGFFYVSVTVCTVVGVWLVRAGFPSRFSPETPPQRVSLSPSLSLCVCE